MKNLIIGGNGYVGSYLYEKIEADSVDLCVSGNDLGFSKKINFDLINIEEYKNIILLAGHSSVQMCEYNKKNAWKNNVTYFYNLCEKLRDDQLLIYASSASVYGKKTDLCEEHQINLNPINHYDLTKLTIDIIANKFIGDGKNIVGLRFGTVNGYSKNIRSDLMINSMVYSYKTQGFIETANDWIKRPILGTQDLVNAIDHILKHDQIHTGQFNICSFNSTVSDIANTISKKVDCKIIKKENSKKVYDFKISNSKFEKIYGFKFKQDISSVIDSVINSDISLFNERGGRFHDRLLNDHL